jgi:hypothetical protein
MISSNLQTWSMDRYERCGQEKQEKTIEKRKKGMSHTLSLYFFYLHGWRCKDEV